MNIPQNVTLLSLDVDSLFTNVPYTETLEILKMQLERNRLLPGEVGEILDLTNLCMKQNYFRFNGQFYLQNDGLATGSPLSPLMADIFMDNFETQYIVNNSNIVYYYRFVDDLIICWRGSMRQLDLFVSCLNNKHPKIKFKKELEENGSLNFLDLTIANVNSKHQFKIYRKPTHTDTVIPCNSTHPWQHKLAAFHCYVHRLLTVPLSKEHFDSELNTIYQIAISNGYSVAMVNSLVKKKQGRIVNSMLYDALPSENTNKYRCSISYVGRLSDKIYNILRSKNINVAFKTNNSLHSRLCNNKEKVDKANKSGVYKLTCNDCSNVYIGQTGRSFTTRCKEHVSAYRNNHPERSNFAKHLLDFNHSLLGSDSYEILHFCGKGLRLDVLEQLEIIRHNSSGGIINEQVNFASSPLLRIPSSLSNID